MTDEEIKKIARRFAELKGGHAVCSETEIQKRALLLEQYTHFLMEDFCIVPRSKVNALHEEIHGEIMCAHDDDDWQSAAHYILDVMPRTFVDIFGKDTFEEEGK